MMSHVLLWALLIHQVCQCRSLVIVRPCVNRLSMTHCLQMSSDSTSRFDPLFEVLKSSALHPHQSEDETHPWIEFPVDFCHHSDHSHDISTKDNYGDDFSTHVHPVSCVNVSVHGTLTGKEFYDDSESKETSSPQIENRQQQQNSHSDKGNRLSQSSYQQHQIVIRDVHEAIKSKQLSKVLQIIDSHINHMPFIELKFLVTQSMRKLASMGHPAYCKEVLHYVSNVKGCDLDLYTYTMAMSILNKNRVHEEVLRIYEDMISVKFDHSSEIDAKVYANVARAMGHIRPWSDTLSLLQYTSTVLTNPADILYVSHTALTNLKYKEALSVDDEDNRYIGNAYELFDWLKDQSISPTSQTMDILLAIVCRHGVKGDAEHVLDMIQDSKVPATVFTFNTVLDRNANQGQTDGAVHVLEKMQQAAIYPDSTTMNTLLKLCLQRDDVQAADKILDHMDQVNILRTDYTKATMVRLYARNGMIDAALDVTNSEPNQTITPYIFANTISNVNDCDAALHLLERARSVGKADDVVYGSAVKTCVDTKNYARALEVVKSFLDSGHDLNRILFTTILTACLNHEKQAMMLLDRQAHFKNSDSDSGSDGDCVSSDGGDTYPTLTDISLVAMNDQHSDIDASVRGQGVKALNYFLNVVEQQFPFILSNGICQQITRELIALRLTDAACVIHMRYLSKYTCSSDVLLSLFTTLQQNSKKGDDLDMKRSMARNALGILGMYSFGITNDNAVRKKAKNSKQQEKQKEDNLKRTRGILKSIHFNCILGLLSEARMFQEQKEVFRMMLYSTISIKTSKYSSISLNMTDTRFDDVKLPATLYKPTTFTIAELIRSSREAQDTDMAAQVLRWGLQQAVVLPFGVISDSINFLFKAGEVSKVIELYADLYEAGKLDHWVDRDNLEMDLHTYNKGMAFAAINCAVGEARDMEIALTNAGENVLPKYITVITGKSEGRVTGKASAQGMRKTTIKTTSKARIKSSAPDRDSADQDGYIISSEIQKDLIENFYPPISSFTVPDNPGRLLVLFNE